MAQDALTFLAALPETMIEELYGRWLGGEELPADWQRFFAAYRLGQETAGAREECCHNPAMALKHSGVQSLIYRYRDLGHLLACTDPLSPCPVSHPLLELAAFGLDEADLSTRFTTGRHHLQQATLREFLQSMRETYCREIGIEFMHIQDPSERQWLIDRMEPGLNRPRFSTEYRLRIMEMLHRAVLFEAFLHRRFQGQKRFSLEGGEVLIPVLEALADACPGAGIGDLVLGMPHRGRLNVLAHLFGKPYAHIFGEFRESLDQGFVGDGDVKYHKGYSVDRQFGGGSLHLTLTSNPSHLEAVNPVVEGKARARQDRIGQDGAGRVLPVLLHGDAAFAGQGMVAEVLNMSQLQGYHTGGTIHVVLNNQIGFTTLPKDSRSTRYSTDVAKMLACPILHVHGEQPEAAVHAMLLALAYRQSYRKDVVLELICYRRHGHNEGDEPAFTQPVMYRKIAERLPINRIYADRLVEAGVLREQVDALAVTVNRELEQALEAAPPARTVGFRDAWSGFEREYRPVDESTGVAAGQLQELARQLAVLPAGITPHPKVAALLKKREESVVNGSGIDWGTAETLAYASLLQEGSRIRISGQDARRGTFNHRHAAVYDQESGTCVVPLAELATRQGTAFDIFDSCLSENGVLGFEYGYSLENPRGLTVWEAQFGDFANGAQVIIDQFIAAGETKWNRASGLVLLLPHGYEGQGAEHSSARIERYLQLCAKENLLVAIPSTPAQVFHLLRRQVHLPFRKPLVVFTPKSLLRNPSCVSTLAELGEGSRFRELLLTGDPATARRILFCSGKLYHELAGRLAAGRTTDIAVVRLEQLYPLRQDMVRELLADRAAGAECCWVQEEPENMGAWRFVRPLLEELVGPLRYIGREAESCPAVGSHHLHDEQQQAILTEACS
ncbi:2-oxoglutarate dehydrogenase E1 component [Trichlorobacter ammonificans]|uniref:oxoglutarate dehydrogenase (succinyl-transferring) n=1 Tax=Trichlorobacter ammonificans TaxID=2916410 RepID=A0ABN8HCZ2_9BACT|nr:2-oxoglutarate dehydrogenase E1 component [Trichlorobacter ammonificans]CAH2030654.1 2-oxoglutarate dehydrogenase, dehydrogenase (E1) component [Trichlorobacter ammonificans]